jgi:hypothetical protein
MEQNETGQTPRSNDANATAALHDKISVAVDEDPADGRFEMLEHFENCERRYILEYKSTYISTSP